MSELSRKLTVVVKTFERPDMVRRAVKSLRKLHPLIPMIVADDSRNPITFDEDPITTCLQLPFDSGISYGRNRALEKVETPYYLLIDDDHCFEEDCNLGELVEILENTDFNMVGMRMLNYRSKRGYCRGELQFAGTLVRENDKMIHYIGRNRGIHMGFPIYDILLNCYAAKISNTKQISYDENIKIGKEHGDYFLAAKKVGFKATLSRNSFIHHRPLYSSEYIKFRSRSDNYTSYYFDKHDITSEATIGKNYLFFDKIKYFPQRIKYLAKRLTGRKID